MWALIGSIGLASAIVLGSTVERRVIEGKPALPKLSGFSSTGLLTPGDQIEEVYQQEDSLLDMQPVVDMQVDAQVDEWLSEHADDHLLGYTAPDTPETLGNYGGNTHGNYLETPLETIDLSSEVSNASFQIVSETPLETNSETLNRAYFTWTNGDFDNDEYAVFCDLVDDDNLSPTGKPIIMALWGIKPGSNYGKAKDKRDMYAKRKSQNNV